MKMTSGGTCVASMGVEESLKLLMAGWALLSPLMPSLMPFWMAEEAGGRIVDSSGASELLGLETSGLPLFCQSLLILEASMTMVLRFAANGFGGGVMMAAIGARASAILLSSLCALITALSMPVWSTTAVSRLLNGLGGGVIVASIDVRVDFRPLMKVCALEMPFRRDSEFEAIKGESVERSPCREAGLELAQDTPIEAAVLRSPWIEAELELQYAEAALA